MPPKNRHVFVYNKTKETFLAFRVTVADSILSRLVGLLGKRSLKPDSGVWIVPANAIHTIGMLFTFDLVLIDKDFKVVGLRELIRPFRVTRPIFRAESVLELPAHAIFKSRTEVGDQLVIERYEARESAALRDAADTAVATQGAGDDLFPPAMPARPPIDAALIVQAMIARQPIPGAGLPGNSYSKREVDIGRIAQTWELIGNSFAVLKADRELLWLPVFSGIFCVLVSVAILGGAGLLFLPPVDVAAALKHHSMSQGMWVCLFLFYLANYFVIVFFNVALVSAASSRLAGGQATINDGLEVAWQRKGKIFQWALLSATVGILLRMIEERASWLGRLVGGLMGMAWTLASYFVVPVLAAENVGPAEALQRSADLFREYLG